jgi:hypothetical protein
MSTSLLNSRITLHRRARPRDIVGDGRHDLGDGLAVAGDGEALALLRAIE